MSMTAKTFINLLRNIWMFRVRYPWVCYARDPRESGLTG
jgi:hypothetical protein